MIDSITVDDPGLEQFAELPAAGALARILLSLVLVAFGARRSKALSTSRGYSAD